MPRNVFIGDIHGCFDEVVELLETIGVKKGDRVVALGDLTRKGPAADRCLDLWRDRGYLSVLGNNDLKVMQRSRSFLRRWLAAPEDRRVTRRRDLLDFMRTWPVSLDFPDIGVVAVHGGILPNSDRFNEALVPKRAALTLRHVRKDKSGVWQPVPKGEHRKGDPFWADVWDGDRIVVYGHTPRDEPKVHARAIGLDTGCVYGGALTAAVFEDSRNWRLMSVPSRRKR